jgi:hypothetical protein
MLVFIFCESSYRQNLVNAEPLIATKLLSVLNSNDIGDVFLLGVAFFRLIQSSDLNVRRCLLVLALTSGGAAFFYIDENHRILLYLN